MANMHDLPYPKRLIVEMLHYSFWSCEKTKDRKLSEIKEALSFFFERDDIESAIKAFTGNAS